MKIIQQQLSNELFHCVFTASNKSTDTETNLEQSLSRRNPRMEIKLVTTDRKKIAHAPTPSKNLPQSVLGVMKFPPLPPVGYLNYISKNCSVHVMSGETKNK